MWGCYFFVVLATTLLCSPASRQVFVYRSSVLVGYFSELNEDGVCNCSKLTSSDDCLWKFCLQTNAFQMEEEVAVRLQQVAADLLATVRGACKTSQRAADTIVSGVDDLFDIILDLVKEKIRKLCSSQDGYISLSHINAAIDSLKGQSVFEGIGTNPRLEKYFSHHSGGDKVLLKEVVLKWKTVTSRGIPRKVPSLVGYFIPFLSQLEQFLNIPEVLECVDNPLPKKSGVYQTVLDGLFYSKHPVVELHGHQTLCFSIHVDDVEVCDPLKSKAGKNNLRLFYWLLGNIHPKKRSTLRAINLLAIVKSKIAKEYGNDHFLRDFIDAMKLLGTEGVEFNINGCLRRFYGILLCVSADNPASSNLGRFKETHSALRPCRVCMVTSSCMCQVFFEDYSLIRKSEEHEVFVNLVESTNKPAIERVEVRNICEKDLDDPQVTEEDFDSDIVADKYHDHKDPSVNYGVNGRSILSEAPGFDVTSCLPQDVMHLLAEGVVELVCRLVLRELCCPVQPTGPKVKRVKPLIPLLLVNQIIQEVCDFGHLSVSRPSVIEHAHLKGRKLKQSASQMFVLLNILPFLIFKVCSKAKLDVVLKLIKLVDYCMSYTFKNSDFDVLRNLIEDFGNAFKKAYPNVKTLKLHCLVHLPSQLRLFGPLRQQACFRFEAFHSEFTSLASVIRNMINYPLSAASRYLTLRNFQIMKGKEDGSYLYVGDQFIHPESVAIEKLSEKDTILGKFPDLNESSVIIQLKEFSHHSNKWREGVAFLLDQENALFGRVSTVYLIEESIVFTFNRYRTKFHQQTNSYEIVRCEPQLNAICLSELEHKFPVVRFSFNFKEGTIAYLLLQKNASVEMF